jgi:hypothetical protein
MQQLHMFLVTQFIPGIFPLSWASFQQHIFVLVLDDNPKLEGCVPVSQLTTTTFTGECQATCMLCQDLSSHIAAIHSAHQFGACKHAKQQVGEGKGGGKT